MKIERGEVFTIPNFISFVRILLIIPLVYAFYIGNYVLAAGLLLASGLSDMVDGFIARKLNQVSELGKMLDPIADKLTLIATGFSLAFIFSGIKPLILVLIIKDMLMLLGGLILLKNGINPPAAKWYGKLSTVIFYACVVILVALDAFWDYENPILTYTLLTITIASMSYSFIRYLIIAIGLFKEKKAYARDKKTL